MRSLVNQKYWSNHRMHVLIVSQEMTHRKYPLQTRKVTPRSSFSARNEHHFSGHCETNGRVEYRIFYKR